MRLSPREAQVLRLIQSGKGNNQIAVELGVSLARVHAIVRGIKNKTGVELRRDLEKLRLP